jgi:hypothetical protein
MLRTALCRWAFNTVRRDGEDCPAGIRAALKWAAGHTRSVSALVKPDVLRAVLDGLTVRLDGKPAAPSVVRRKILNAAVEYAVELKLLDSNPIPALKWTAPKTVHAVDRRSVANPIQARTLFNAVREQRISAVTVRALHGPSACRRKRYRPISPSSNPAAIPPATVPAST